MLQFAAHLPVVNDGIRRPRRIVTAVTPTTSGDTSHQRRTFPQDLVEIVFPRAAQF